MSRPCEDHGSRDCGVCHRPVTVTREVLPADCEGELRELAREMDAAGRDMESDALLAIIDRYSGVRPMRTGHICPDKGTGKVVLP